MIRERIAILFIAAAAPACSAHAGEPPRYVYIDLGVLSDEQPFARAHDISENGWVTGYSFDEVSSGFYSHTFVWPPRGPMQNLGELPEIADRSNFGDGVNDAGVVVGYAVFGEMSNLKNFANAYVPPTMWIENKVFSLGLFECGHDGRAHAINNHNQAVGYNAILLPNDEVINRAFLWENGKLNTIPGLPDNVRSIAEDINDLGHIVGRASLTGVSRPFLARNGEIIDLGKNLDFLAGWARGVNNLDQVVGRSPEYSWIWDDGEAVALPNLYDIFVDAFDINDYGDIVGVMPGGFREAVLWYEGAAYALNDLIQRTPDMVDLHLLGARAINNKGQIVGYARTKNVALDEYAFLLEPVTPDFNHDDTVTSADLAQLLSMWSSDDPYTDLNGDGAVNGVDLANLLANWGPIPEREPYDWIP